MKQASLIIMALSCTLAACQRAAPPDLNPPPAPVGHVPSAAFISEARPLPAIDYAEQTATITAGGRAPYAVALKHVGGAWPASALRVTWQWLDAAGALMGEPTVSPSPMATTDARDVLVRFDVVAPAKPGDYRLKVWLARVDGASLEARGSRPLHYLVHVE